MKNSELINDLVKSYSIQLFRGDNGEPCITFIEDGKKKTFLLRSEKFRLWLIRVLRGLGQKASHFRRAEIEEEFCALADEGNTKNLYVRVGRAKDSSLLVDINDESYDAIHISRAKKGFKIALPDDVAFLRPNKQRSLPRPVSVNRKRFLKLFRNLVPDLVYGHWLLILAFILKAIDRDSGAYAILLVGGPQGSGKTILSNRIKELVDPSMPRSFSPPRNYDDIIVASSHSHLLVFDNISGISSDMADAFCRLSTGGGVAARKKYTDSDEVSYKLLRPVVINGIDEPTNRSDFLDRCVLVELKPFQSGARVAESELEREFEVNRPLLAGGIYELLADCLHVLPAVTKTTTNLPRMTDYALMGVAIEKVLKLKPGTFLEIYKKNRDEQSENAFWSDDLCGAIYRRLQRAQNHRIEGSAQELKGDLFRRGYGQTGGSFSTKRFTGWLKRIEPLLKTRGIVVERPPRSATKRTIIIRSLNPMPQLDSYPWTMSAGVSSDRGERERINI